MKVEIIKCLKDNFSYLLINENITNDIRGLEISKSNVQKCVAKGLTVIEGDAEKDLKQFPN